jgi:hypothetical protein
MKKYALILLIPIIVSCGKEKLITNKNDIFSEEKKVLDTEIKRLSQVKNQHKTLQTNSYDYNDFNYRAYVEGIYGYDAGIFYDNILNHTTNEIEIPNDLQYLDTQTPYEISQTINSEFQQITNFDEILQNQNVSMAMQNKLNELKTSLLNLGENKFSDAIYNNDETILQDENSYIQNLENEVSQILNDFNLSIGANFTLTPAEQNQLLMSSYLAGESLNNSSSLINYFNNLDNSLQVNSSDIALNGFFKSVLNTLKTIAKVVLVIVVSVAIVAAVVATGAVLGALVGASLSLIVGGTAVAGGSTAGALFGLLIGGQYISSEKYQDSRLVNWMVNL